MSDRPNIVMMTCHDLGRHLGCYGVPTVQSPNIDRLAEEGCRVENYFATAAVCSPSRGAMMTGRYPQANGLMGLTHSPWMWRYHDGERHLARILVDAGYRTTLVGFQHVTLGDPLDLGYQRYERGGDSAPERAETAAGLLAAEAAEDRPFFMKIGFVEVHRKFLATGAEPDSEQGVYVPPYLADTETIRDDLADLQGVVKFMDAAVGRVLDGLKAAGLADNTIVIFTADHGIPYIGAKWTLFDPGIMIPLVIRWPGGGITGGRVHPQLMSNVDFLPTLLEMVGVAVPENVQGVSAAPILRGASEEPIRDAVFAEHLSHALRDNTCRCIRTDRYKLIRYFEPGRTILKPIDAHPQGVAEHTVRPRRNGTRPVVHLFDLQEDPLEVNNLSRDEQHADTVRELSDRLWQWMEDIGDPILHGPIRTPYYEEAMEDYARFSASRQTPEA